ncbi:hypothetical protein OH492_28955 [Vibrio chagasii]|nr:hypothetical protein [Vibrio chagasii]
MCGCGASSVKAVSRQQAAFKLRFDFLITLNVHQGGDQVGWKRKYMVW